MVYQCTGFKTFSYRDKRTNQETTATIFYGFRRPLDRDGSVTGFVGEEKFITERDSQYIPRGGFKPNSVYNFKYESDGKYSYLVGIDEVEKL